MSAVHYMPIVYCNKIYSVKDVLWLGFVLLREAVHFLEVTNVL